MSRRFRIGDLTLDTGRRLLLRNSERISVGPLTYRLLRTLVEAAPNVVSHDELAQLVWNGRSVSPETISQRVKLLRHALSDDSDSARYIEGVRGQGYRLLPPVELLPDDSRPPDRAGSVPRVALAVCLLMIAMALLWAFAIQPRFLLPASSSHSENNSIAVLPFDDMSVARDQQYLADGIAEEILNLLSKGTRLRVVARTSSFSFRGKNSDIPRIGEALRVTHVLEGSVRPFGERIRVTVRLVDASDGSRVWSQSYDQPVGDILDLQAAVARTVAAELKVNLQDTAERRARRVPTEAYDLYLHGQQKMAEWNYREAARYFERSLAIDAEFVPAYDALGVVHVMEVVDVRVPVAENREKLRALLSRGLRLAPQDPGLLALSAQLARYEGEMKLAEERFAAALEKDPSNSVVRRLYSMFKLDQGDPEEALRLIQHSLEVDPFNPITYTVVWASHLDLWHEEEALAAARRYQELCDASDTTGDAMTAMTRMLLAGDLAGAITNINKGVARLQPNYPGTPVWMPLFYYLIDDLEEGDAQMESARQTSWNGWWINHAEVYRPLAHGNVGEARRVALASAPNQDVWGGGETDVFALRLAIDALIAGGEAPRAVAFIEKLAPEYARYKTRKSLDASQLAPAPIPLKSAYSSYPALYFPDYIRALRAAGDEKGANNMLDHLDAVLALRRKRGLFFEERHAAEALALRGQTDAALAALEKAERDRTIYHWWQAALLHNEIFAGLRTHPRFEALVVRIQDDLRRQRDQLARIN